MAAAINVIAAAVHETVGYNIIPNPDGKESFMQETGTDYDAMGFEPLANLPTRNKSKVVYNIVQLLQEINDQEKTLIKCAIKNKNLGGMPPFVGILDDKGLKPQMQYFFLPIDNGAGLGLQYFSILQMNFDDKISNQLLSDMLSNPHVLRKPDGVQPRDFGRGVQWLLDHFSGWKCTIFTVCTPGQASTPDAKKVMSQEAILEGFRFMRQEGPPTNGRGEQLEWSMLQVNRQDSPIFGWNEARVKEYLRAITVSSSTVHPEYNWPLTLLDLNPVILEKALYNFLPTIHTKGILWIGRPGVGKTPGAKIVAFQTSEYHIRQDGKMTYKACFRVTNDLDTLKQEVGTKYSPVILDDCNTRDMPSSTTKAFGQVDANQSTTHERYGHAKFTSQCLRQLCSNYWNVEKEPGKEEIIQAVSADTFLEIVRPNFSASHTDQDIYAILKRMHCVIATWEWLYVRTADEHAKDVPIYKIDADFEFLDPSCKPTFEKYHLDPDWTPDDFADKMNWSTELFRLAKDGIPIPASTYVRDPIHQDLVINVKPSIEELVQVRKEHQEEIDYKSFVSRPLPRCTVVVGDDDTNSAILEFTSQNFDIMPNVHLLS